MKVFFPVPERGPFMAKALKDLNLIDNFLFSQVIENPVHAEMLAKEILTDIFEREFDNLKVTAQKELLPPLEKYHGIRMDAYIEENAAELSTANIFDLEPETKRKRKKNLPRRSRFYHSKIDGFALASGADYIELKDVCVIFIVNFDPFGMERMIYTIRSRCVEEPEMEYDDGAATLFLYTRGTQGIVPEKLKNLLRYMDDTTVQNAVTPGLKRIQSVVDKIKLDPEIKEGYMDFAEYIEMEIKDARAEAREEGLAEGREEGLAEGREKGLAEGRKKGLEEAKKEYDSLLEKAQSEADQAKKEAEAERIRADILEKELARLKNRGQIQ